MQIDEAERERVESVLERQNAGLWLKLASEVHYGGDEAPFWFLVSGPERLRAAVDAAMPVLHEASMQFRDTKFTASFSEKKDDRQIIWEFLTEEELRAGTVKRELGTSPSSFKLDAYDVFGPNPPDPSTSRRP